MDESEVSAGIVVRHRRLARIGYPLLTLLFAAITLAGLTQGSVAAVLVGAAGTVVGVIWSANARMGCLLVTADTARLRTARGWQEPVRFDQLKKASWTKTRTGAILVLVERGPRHLVVSTQDFPTDDVLAAVRPPLVTHRARLVLDDRIGSLLGWRDQR